MRLISSPSIFSLLLPPAEPIKKAVVAHQFGCGASLTRFDAERLLHDHTLNSTVSELRNDHGLIILSQRVRVPNFLGKTTSCCKYSLDRSPENLSRLFDLLLGWGFRLPPNTKPSALAVD